MSTTAIPQHMAHAYTNMKVNVRLCGSIPRVDLSPLMQQNQNQHPYKANNVTGSLNACSLLPEIPASYSARTKENGSVAQQLCSQLHTIQQQQELSHHRKKEPINQAQHSNFHSQEATPPRRQSPTYEAPSWAVPASGEARLEPVCDSVDTQGPVDLTSQAVFRVGRSPQTDVQLMHVTSSRRHAMIFHHSNGSCYLVDCGSSHGTYINGIRVISKPNESNVVIPTRVRRGSMVRFGGPGAPSFVLKAFSFDLDEIRECPVPTLTLRPSRLPSSPVLSVMVEQNTRINSLGRTAQEELMGHRQISSKRSYDSLDTEMDSDVEDCDDDDVHRRRRSSHHLSSPPLSPEQSLLRLVSPDMNNSVCEVSGYKRRRVTFSDENLLFAYPILVSPDVSSDEQDNYTYTPNF